MRRSYLCSFILFMLGIIIIFFINYYSNTIIAPDQKNINVNSFIKDQQGRGLGLRYRIINENAPRQYIYKAEISGEQFEKIDSDVYKVIVNRLACQWYKIYFNNQLIGTRGDIENGYSNLWNCLAMFDLDPDIIQEKNEMIIEIYGEAEMGMFNPILITDLKDSYIIYNWFIFGLDNLVIVAIVLYIFSFILFMIAYYKDRSKRRLLYIGLSVVSLALYLFSFQPLPYITGFFYRFKPFFSSLIYLAVFFMSRGLYKRYGVKLNLYLSYPALSAFLLISLFTSSSTYLILYRTFMVIILINIMGWIYTSFKYIKSVYGKIIFYSSIYIVITMIYDWYKIITGRNMSIHLTLVSIFIFSISAVAFVIIEFLTLQKQMSEHKKMAESLYQKSITDGMTGTYNHEYITSLLEEVKKQYALIIMDIDDFKQINDQYGHQFGDMIIKYVAESIKNNVRKSDIVGRYGGDEFIIILYDCPVEKAILIANNIKDTIEEPYEFNYHKLNITVSIGVYISKEGEHGSTSLSKADQALYYVKGHGKADIKLYNN